MCNDDIHSTFARSILCYSTVQWLQSPTVLSILVHTSDNWSHDLPGVCGNDTGKKNIFTGVFSSLN